MSSVLFAVSPPDSILEKNLFQKSTGFYFKSDSRVIIQSKPDSFDPLDTTGNYRVTGDEYQSFSLSMTQKNGSRKHGFYGNVHLWSEDTAGLNLETRASSLNYYLNNYGFLQEVVVGRQHVHTGFHYYKLDGVKGQLTISEKNSLSFFGGSRVDTTWQFSNRDNLSGNIQFNRNIGLRSRFFVGYELAALSNRINANDLGFGAVYKAKKGLILKSKSRLSWKSGVHFTETKNLASYYLNKRHMIYAGYNFFNPVFRDTLQAYYFDIFDYNKGHLGWHWRIFKKRDIHFNAEASLLQVHEVGLVHLKAGLMSRYLDLSYIQRLGNLTGAAMAGAHGKYPFFSMVTAGAGVDYANMDLYYQGSRHFYNFFGYVKIQPIRAVTGLVRVENRQSLFTERDVRILGHLTIFLANNTGRNFVWEE